MKNQKHNIFRLFVLLGLCLAVIERKVLTAQSFDLTPVGFFNLEKNYSDISIAPKGTIYLLSHELSVIDQYSTQGKIISSYGKAGSGSQELKNPSSVWSQNDLNIFVSDFGNDRIVMLTGELGFISTIEGSSYEINDLAFRKPLFVAVLYNSDFLILDGENKTFLRFNKNNPTVEKFGGIESGNLQLSDPAKVYYGNNQILVYDQADSTYKFYSEFGSPLNSFKNKFSPCRNWNRTWVTIINNNLVELLDRREILADFNPLVDEPIIDFEIAGNRFYLLTETKVIILNVSKP